MRTIFNGTSEQHNNDVLRLHPNGHHVDGDAHARFNTVVITIITQPRPQPQPLPNAFARLVSIHIAARGHAVQE